MSFKRGSTVLWINSTLLYTINYPWTQAAYYGFDLHLGEKLQSSETNSVSHKLFCYMHYTPVLLPDFRAPRKDPPIRESPSFRSSTTICLRGIGYRSVWNYKYKINDYAVGRHVYQVCIPCSLVLTQLSTCSTDLCTVWSTKNSLLQVEGYQTSLELVGSQPSHFYSLRQQPPCAHPLHLSLNRTQVQVHPQKLPF